MIYGELGPVGALSKLDPVDATLRSGDVAWHRFSMLNWGPVDVRYKIHAEMETPTPLEYSPPPGLKQHGGVGHLPARKSGLPLFSSDLERSVRAGRGTVERSIAITNGGEMNTALDSTEIKVSVGIQIRPNAHEVVILDCSHLVRHE
ncbi:hypothetical protein [Aquipuribacter sp. MA13-6]|uniref:hypothetical protein n=1 Tax=unclassified Aquipuribacter TaxID=2635084 RepID=UPI003EE971A4